MSPTRCCTDEEATKNWRLKTHDEKKWNKGERGHWFSSNRMHSNYFDWASTAYLWRHLRSSQFHIFDFFASPWCFTSADTEDLSVPTQMLCPFEKRYWWKYNGSWFEIACFKGMDRCRFISFLRTVALTSDGKLIQGFTIFFRSQEQDEVCRVSFTYFNSVTHVRSSNSSGFSWLTK